VELIERTRSAGRRIASATPRLEGPRAAIERGRANPRLAIAAIAAALLLIAWIVWAIYVTTDNGANAGLGVVVAWPSLLVALALAASPFVGLYFLIRHLQGEQEIDEQQSDEEEFDEQESDEEESGEQDSEEEGPDEAEEEDPGEEAEEPEETDPDEEPPSGEKATSASG
jgi:hypothetical protein